METAWQSLKLWFGNRAGSEPRTEDRHGHPGVPSSQVQCCLDAGSSRGADRSTPTGSSSFSMNDTHHTITASRNVGSTLRLLMPSSQAFLIGKSVRPLMAIASLPIWSATFADIGASHPSSPQSSRQMVTC